MERSVVELLGPNSIIDAGLITVYVHLYCIVVDSLVTTVGHADFYKLHVLFWTLAYSIVTAIRHAHICEPLDGDISMNAGPSMGRTWIRAAEPSR